MVYKNKDQKIERLKKLRKEAQVNEIVNKILLVVCLAIALIYFALKIVWR